MTAARPLPEFRLGEHEPLATRDSADGRRCRVADDPRRLDALERAQVDDFFRRWCRTEPRARRWIFASLFDADVAGELDECLEAAGDRGLTATDIRRIEALVDIAFSRLSDAGPDKIRGIFENADRLSRW